MYNSKYLKYKQKYLKYKQNAGASTGIDAKIKKINDDIRLFHDIKIEEEDDIEPFTSLANFITIYSQKFNKTKTSISRLDTELNRMRSQLITTDSCDFHIFDRYMQEYDVNLNSFMDLHSYFKKYIDKYNKIDKEIKSVNSNLPKDSQNDKEELTKAYVNIKSIKTQLDPIIKEYKQFGKTQDQYMYDKTQYQYIRRLLEKRNLYTYIPCANPTIHSIYIMAHGIIIEDFTPDHLSLCSSNPFELNCIDNTFILPHNMTMVLLIENQNQATINAGFDEEVQELLQNKQLVASDGKITDQAKQFEKRVNAIIRHNTDIDNCFNLELTDTKAIKQQISSTPIKIKSYIGGKSTRVNNHYIQFEELSSDYVANLEDMNLYNTSYTKKKPSDGLNGFEQFIQELHKSSPTEDFSKLLQSNPTFGYKNPETKNVQLFQCILFGDDKSITKINGHQNIELLSDILNFINFIRNNHPINICINICRTVKGSEQFKATVRENSDSDSEL
jgi:hypothetical protein